MSSAECANQEELSVREFLYTCISSYATSISVDAPPNYLVPRVHRDIFFNPPTLTKGCHSLIPQADVKRNCCETKRSCLFFQMGLSVMYAYKADCARLPLLNSLLNLVISLTA